MTHPAPADSSASRNAGLLDAIYSLPNVVQGLIGGIMVDRLGAGRRMFWTSGICFLGAALTAASPAFPVMAAGRLLFGVGAETSASPPWLR